MSIFRQMGLFVISMVGMAGFTHAAPTTDWSINSSKYANTASGWYGSDSTNHLNAAKLTNPVVSGGQSSGETLYSPILNNPVLHAPTAPDAITDVPGTTTTNVPNTTWVDTNYMPRNVFVKTSTVTVCSSGCNYVSPQAAWDYVKGLLVRDPEERITIQIADGTYTFSSTWNIDDPAFERVSIIGDIADRTKVVFNFTNTKGTSADGIAVTGSLGLLDGVTITTPSDGTGAINTISSDGLDISWNPGSESAGITVNNQGRVSIGQHVAISNFYYGLRLGGSSYATANSLQISNSAFGIYAQNKSAVDCASCIFSVSSDGNSGSNIKVVTDSLITLSGDTFSGSRSDAIYASLGSTVYIYGATLSCSAKNITASTNGIHADMGSNISVNQSNIQGCYNGIDVEQAATAHLDTVTVQNNTSAGVMVAQRGYVYGTSIKALSNSGSAFTAVTGGSLYATGSSALASGNGTLLVQDASPSTNSTTGAVTQPASAFLN